MDQSFLIADTEPIAKTALPVANSLIQLASIVRGLTTELLHACETRIVRIAVENEAGWSVEVEVFAPNPELTVSLHGDKAILDRRRYRLHFDLDLQLVALEPAEE